MSNIRIPLLLVDDKKFMLESIKSYIENKKNWNISGLNYSFEVMDVQDAEIAVLLYAKYNHDIVIMDLDMPNMNGIVAVKQILEINPNATIIGMASETDSNIDEFKSSGIKFFLEKPFQDTYINSRIESIMNEIIKDKSLEELDLKNRKKSLFKKLFSK